MNNLSPSQRQGLLNSIKLQDKAIEVIKDDPLKYAKQHDKQKAATAAMQAIRTLFWGNRVGKTEWGAQEVSRYATNNHPYRDIGEPIEIWAACPSFDAQEETTQKKLLTYLPANLS